jgi:hypothetical protein
MNTRHHPSCDCHEFLDRRTFLKVSAAGSAAVFAGSLPSASSAKESANSSPESIVRHLYDSLTPKQKETICFDWNFIDGDRGLLRTRVENNWQVTDAIVNSDFYTDDQRRMIRDIFEGLTQPEWHEKFYQQLQDDAGGFGEQQAIAIFGKPGDEKFEFVMTGRHMTIRCDGNTTEHVAFGGPIFYGHAARDFNESKDHEGNVFWHQALEANRVYQMLDEKQRSIARVAKTPDEQRVGFRGKAGNFLGIPVSELSSDQKEGVQKVLRKLIEPYRTTDQNEVVACLNSQGGLDRCHLAFFADDDIGNDQVWDNWRLEGPSFVWHFRGSPHVHVWVNVADDPSVKLNV